MELDVRDLLPPEPFARIMQSLETLPAGAILRVRIHREPYPLYDVLRAAGHHWQTLALAEDDFQIDIEGAR